MPHEEGTFIWDNGACAAFYVVKDDITEVITSLVSASEDRNFIVIQGHNGAIAA